MSRTRADLVVCGDVIVKARSDGPERVEAIGIAGGRVVAAGHRAEVFAAASAGARIVDAGDAAVIPGLHDFHVHLVGLARSRSGVLLDDAEDAHEVAARLTAHLAGLGGDAWLTGRGWSEAQLAGGLEPLRTAVGDRAAVLSSHDGHSAWASPAALRVAGVTATTPDPEGGRIERDGEGQPIGILRETAMDLVNRIVPRLGGAALEPQVDALLHELAAFGITGASEAGDYTDENGTGPDAALGDSFSTLSGLGDTLDGRLRLTIGIPVDALAAAAEREMRTGDPLSARRTLRMGWAKEYADGALGSGTAALFEPATCGDADVGLLRVGDDELDTLFAASRRSRIALAIHAIGDRAAAVVLDAVERAPARPSGMPADRIEHAQLMRPADRDRLARLGVTASVQPIHAAADRDLVERCWGGRQTDAYAWGALISAGALLAAGSDAPVESIDPWLGLFAAVHRRLPDDERGDWRPDESLRMAEALAAYTIAPARALGVADEGHLRPGARADLAILDAGVDVLMACDERLAAVRSVLTLIDGRVVHER
ncbi:MAG: amidohydrolase [Chloroflexi bacterium]|nr:amidohydrolase [Chloroflexota bacterium]